MMLSRNQPWSEVQGVKLVEAARVDAMSKRSGWVMCGVLRLTQQACKMPEGSWNFPGHFAEVGNERGKICVECPGRLSYSTG